MDKNIVFIKTCDMHTAGEPVRIIKEGYPDLEGDNILEKRAIASAKYDNYRKLVMNEPRGHKDMYGVILTKPTKPEADIAVLFTQNEGYSSMCGHATIALGRYAVDNAYVKAKCPETEVCIECPCGIVRAFVQYDNGKTGSVRFESVPAFVFELDAKLESDRFGGIKVDVVYGGAFYLIFDVSQISMDLEKTSLSVLVEAASHVSKLGKDTISLHHPDNSDLAFLYGTILTDGKDNMLGSKNICVFADRAVDRSPTGSGVTARMALQFERGQTSVGQVKIFESVIGTKFTGKVVRQTTCGDFKAVVVEVSGEAFYTGEHSFRLEKDDPLQEGFLLHQ